MEEDNTVTFKVGEGGEESQIEIIHPTDVTISQEELTLDVEHPEAVLTAEATPEDITFKNIIWTSSDINTVLVRDGIVRAVKRGEAIVTATTHGGEIKAQCKVICNLPEAITNVSKANTNAANARKVFENGQVIIVRDNEKYSLLGERIE